MPIPRISGKIKNRKYSRAQNDNSFSYSKPQSFKKRIKSAHFKTVNVHILEKLPSKNSQNFKSGPKLVIQESSQIWICHLPTMLEKCSLLLDLLFHFNFLYFKLVCIYNQFLKKKLTLVFIYMTHNQFSKSLIPVAKEMVSYLLNEIEIWKNYNHHSF